MDKRPGWRKKIALELFRSLKRNRARLHELRTLSWECTLRCNLSCRHCGNDCHTSSEQPDMPVEDFLHVIDDITPFIEPSRLMVSFTGGEPLMRKDIERCGLELYTRGFPWGMITNGTLLNRSRLDSLLAAGLSSITVSLDGFEEPHNWLRKDPSCYEKTLEAVCMLSEEENITWDITTCVNQQNFENLLLFKEFLIELGVKEWRLSTLFPVKNDAETSKLQLSDKQFTWLMNFIRHCRQEGKIQTTYGCEGFLGNYEAEVRDQLFQCSAGISKASVLANGTISGCTSVRTHFYQGNIYKDKFMERWEDGFEMYRDRSWAQKGQCADCEVFRYCEGSGMHLYDNNNELLVCHYKKLI